MFANQGSIPQHHSRTQLDNCSASRTGLFHGHNPFLLQNLLGDGLFLPHPLFTLLMLHTRKNTELGRGRSLPVYPWSSSCLLPPSSPELLYSLGCSQLDLPGSYFKSFIAIQLPYNPFSGQSRCTHCIISQEIRDEENLQGKRLSWEQWEGLTWRTREKDLIEGENIGFEGMGH